jgi:predicted MPP superfamily phosphohydrolase
VLWRIVVVATLWTTLWWAIIGALVAPLVPGGWAAIAAAEFLALAPLIALMQRSRGVQPSTFIRLFIFRPFWYAQLGTLVMALAGALGFAIGLPFGAGVTSGRVTLAIAGAAFVLAALAGYVGSKYVGVKRFDAAFDALPPALDGLRIVQISDLHVGPHTSRHFLARVVRLVEEERPDVIAITGDQVDDYAGDVEHFAAAFRSLTAPHGVYAIAGNHDVYAGWNEVRAGLEAMGLRVLVNEAVEIARDGARFWIAGTGDPAGTVGPINPDRAVAPDITRTLARVPPGAFTIALAHNPALWPALAERGVDLTLSGHTHHGQLSIPHMDWSLASHFLEHAMGTHRRGRSLLYINPGTNYWGLPLRLGAWSEVTAITLRSSATASAMS